MKIAIDKTSIKSIRDFNEFEYVYIFDDEKLEDLLKLKLHCIRKEYVEEVDINLTEFDIECIKKAKVSEENWYKLPDFKNNKIAIIIPNYNYEHTLEKCLNSIAEQTYKNYDVIFVDDCSTDKSVKIAKSFKDKMNIKIIELKQKRLNGGARNEAYLHLSGDIDYVYYVDSDDWLYDENVLQKINRALIRNPDVLFVGLAQYKGDKLSIAYLPKYRDKYEAIVGWSGSCGKVIKKSLAIRQECLYPEGTLKEDRTQHRKICFYMNSFECLDKPIYVWNRQNVKSVTTIRDKIVWGTSTIRHYADTLQFALSIKGKDQKIDKIMENAIRETKKEMESGNDRQW